MWNFRHYGIVLLLYLDLGVSLEELKVEFDGHITKCSTREIYALAFKNISFNQLKGIQQNYRTNDEDNFRCNLGDDELCDEWWLAYNWRRKNSVKRQFKDFITDVRWQEFEPLPLGNLRNKDFIFTKLATIEQNTFHVPISWKIPGDIHLYFCENARIKMSNCYWIEVLIEIGITKVRKCLQGTIPIRTGDNPSGSCSIVLLEHNITSKLNPNEWTAIMLTKTATELTASHITKNDNSKLFSYVLQESLNVKVIFARLKDGEGVAKVHNYNFVQTIKAGFHQIGRPFKTNRGWLCISLYVSMCRNCRMVFMMTGHVLADISFSDEGTWRQIKMYISDSKNLYEQLYVQTIGNELVTGYNYWAIDYVQLCSRLHYILVPGTKRYTCEYVHPVNGFPPIIYNSSLSGIPLGFSGDKTDNVYNFQITSKRKTTFDFRCKLKSHKISNLTLELTCQDLVDLQQYETSTTVAIERCGPLSSFYCGSANFTGERLNCTLKVARKTNIEGGKTYYGKNIYFTNSEQAPFEPFNVQDSYNDNDSGIVITCQRPINTNGILKGFEVIYTKASISQKDFRRDRQRHTIRANSTSTLFRLKNHLSYEPCTHYFLQVRAINNYGHGFATTKLTLSPPLLPNELKIKKLVEGSSSADFSLRSLLEHNPIHRHNGLVQYVLVSLTGPIEKSRGLDDMKINSRKGFENISGTVREFDLSQVPNNVTIIFTIGDKTEGWSKYLNKSLESGPLETGKAYQVEFLAINVCQDKTKTYVYHFEVTTGSKEETTFNISIVFYVILSIIWFLVGVGCAIIYNRYRKSKRPKLSFPMGRRPTTLDNIYSLPDLPRVLPKIPEDDKEELLEFQQPEFTTFPVSDRANLNFKRPIKIREFEKYVQYGISKEIETQFLGLPKGLLQPSEEGKLELNRMKNRFNNIIPYDFNRVRLHRTVTSENNDYINASFIKGFKMNQMYIAAQGPKSLTISDFWQMIWQENVRNVVMLVNLEESGQKKVEKYWPNHNEDFRFGNIQVFHHSADSMADYEITVFRMVCDGQHRKIFHYRFLKWPDHGVPTHFHTLVPFVRKTLEISLKSPLVVHCSSGTAATGVFILCDICLRSAQETGVVDVLKVAYELRKQRVNMIDNVLQFKLAHLVIMEVLMGLQSVISCSDDINKFTVKLTSPDELMLQMQYLEDTCWVNKVLAAPNELYYPYKVLSVKNKSVNIIPDSTEAIQLRRYPPSDKSSSYINAVKVDGYQYLDKYIVTQQPMPNTLNDFWRMMVLLDVETIVSLNEVDLTDDKSCEFWPTQTNPQMSPVDFIILKYSSHTEIDNFEKIVVHVHVEGKEKKVMKVNIISLKEWKAHSIIPDDLHNFIKFYCYTDVITKQFPKCCVTCYDGNLASGIFAATSYIIEKIKLEKCYNVCEAVKIIRRNRKQFITDKKQLAYLYEIASTYIKGFETYANFSTSSSALINIYDYIQ